MCKTYILTNKALIAYRVVLFFLLGVPVLGAIGFIFACCRENHMIWPQKPLGFILICLGYYACLLILQLSIPFRIQVDTQRITIVSLLRRRELSTGDIEKVMIRRFHPYLLLPYRFYGITVLKTAKQSIMLPLAFTGMTEFLQTLARINPGLDANGLSPNR